MTLQSNTPEAPLLEEMGLPTVTGAAIDFTDTLKYDPGVDIDKMHNMFRIDGQVSGLWRMLTIPIRSSKMKIVAPEGQRVGRETNFINEVFFSNDYNKGMNLRFSVVLATVLRMLVDGWAPHEIVWKIVDGEIRVKKLAYRSILSTQVKLNRYGEIEKYVQEPRELNSFAYKGKDIPRDKMLHFVHGPEWNLIFGRSIFVQSYYHYEKKHKLYYLAHIASQIKALRLRILKSPASETKERIEEVLKHVAKLGFNSSFNLPAGYELEFPDLGSTDLDLLPMIHHHDIQMSKSVLSQVIDVGTESGAGSYNLSDTHLDIFMMNLGLIAKYISDVINKDLIPKLIDWNFGTGKYPQLEFLPFDRHDRQFLSNLFTRIAGTKVLNISPELRIEIEKQIADLIKADIDFNKITNRDLAQAEEVKELEIDKLKKEIEKLTMQSNNSNPNGNPNGNSNGNSQ